MRTLAVLFSLALSNCLLIHQCTASDYQEQFDEQLQLTPLPDGKLLAHFEFTTHVDAHTTADTSILDYGLFPKVIGQVLQTYQVRDLHLTFTQGRWLYEEWGIPPLPSAGTGVELWAWMYPSKDVDKHWKSLTNVLSGLFCASLNFIDETLTSEPRLSFRSEPIIDDNIDHLHSMADDTVLRYGNLPHENVCTENLTPWIKLLPCKSKAGIAKLLNAHKIYNSNFHSMSIHTTSICKDDACSQRILQLKQTVTSVMDPVRDTSRRDWSLSSIFDRQLDGACPMARYSRVKVISKESPSQYRLQPSPTNITSSALPQENHIAIYDLHQESNELDVRMTWPETVFEYPLAPSRGPLVKVHRYFTGYGQEHGGLRITLQNQHPTDAITVTYFDSIPWYLKLYLHSFKVQASSDQQGKEYIQERDDIVQKMYYQPAIDRARPNMLECQLLLPSKSIVTLTIDFEKVFLKYTEHRPDANRGFDVGPATVTILDHQLDGRNVRIYTDTLLVSLPTPDFSMPYNVITLTCTIIALFFGSIFNLLIRSFVMVDDKQD